MSKKIPIYLAADTLQFLSILTQNDAENIGISSAANLAAQIAAITATQKINLTPDELLYCCDILNGGAHLTEFMPPDHANVTQSLESMMWSLRDGIHESGIFEKWNITAAVVDKLNAMSVPELFALAFATRQFWSPTKFRDYKKPGEDFSYREWAEQFVAASDEN